MLPSQAKWKKKRKSAGVVWVQFTLNLCVISSWLKQDYKYRSHTVRKMETVRQVSPCVSEYQAALPSANLRSKHFKLNLSELFRETLESSLWHFSSHKAKLDGTGLITSRRGYSENGDQYGEGFGFVLFQNWIWNSTKLYVGQYEIDILKFAKKYLHVLQYSIWKWKVTTAFWNNKSLCTPCCRVTMA